MFEYDFKNEDYDIYREVKRAQTDRDVALWFTRHMPINKLVEVFVKEWSDETDRMEKSNK